MRAQTRAPVSRSRARDLARTCGGLVCHFFRWLIFAGFFSLVNFRRFVRVRWVRREVRRVGADVGLGLEGFS